MQSVRYAAHYHYSFISRRTCLYYDRVYTSIINEIFIESSKYSVFILYHWKDIAGLELADRDFMS